MAASQYTENDYRGAVASLDVASEFILLGKIPKETEQNKMLERSFFSIDGRLKAYRAVLEWAFNKPDEWFKPLLNLVHDALECVPAMVVGPADVIRHLPAKQEADREAQQSAQEGRVQQLYLMRHEVEGWVCDTVRQVVDILQKQSFFEGMTGRQLLHATLCLRFIYGEILAGMNPLIVHPESLQDEEGAAVPAGYSREGMRSFAGSVVGEMREAMLLETFKHFDRAPQFQTALPSFVTLALGLGERRLSLWNLCARERFAVLRRKLEYFEENRSQIGQFLLDYCSWDTFVEHALPGIAELNRRRGAAPAERGGFFVPGQLVFVELPTEAGDPVVFGGFDTHSGTRCVAARSDTMPAGYELGFQLSGLGIVEALGVEAKAAAGMRIDASDKVFPTWAHRLLPQEQNVEAEQVSQAVRDTLAFQEGKLAALWRRYPELLSIICESEPTVVVFDGERVVVVGASQLGNAAREAFFSHGEDAAASALAAEVIQRAGIDVQTPSAWRARVLVEASPPQPQEPARAQEPSAEEARQQERRAFRDAVERTGAMNYREFVKALAPWGVVETTDGRGGHGSLKRTLDGAELRAGTWGKLRDPERNMNFARMYEILESLRVPVSEFTARLLAKVLG